MYRDKRPVNKTISETDAENVSAIYLLLGDTGFQVSSYLIQIVPQ